MSSLTLFSGFGLGTVLMPAFAFFFPIPLAIAATAVVHLANNVFKIALVGRNADWKVVALFALPAALAAILGAWLLGRLSWMPSLFSYRLGERMFDVTLLKTTIGVLIIVFGLFDLVPRLQNLAFSRSYLPLGGLLSGFFGGLSGHQGALRSAFLVKTGLDKKAFVGTNAVAGFIVDVVRTAVYGATFLAAGSAVIGTGIAYLVLSATVFAFIGSFAGSRLVKKVTLRIVQMVVGVMLVMAGLALVSGLV